MAKKRYYDFVGEEMNDRAGLPQDSRTVTVPKNPSLNRDWDDSIRSIDEQIRKDMPFNKKTDDKV